jgi:hypothetical protein
MLDNIERLRNEGKNMQEILKRLPKARKIANHENLEVDWESCERYGIDDKEDLMENILTSSTDEVLNSILFKLNNGIKFRTKIHSNVGLVIERVYED